MKPVVTIGDCIIDEVEAGDGSRRRFPGGAGLNLAAGVARLGLPSTLITRVGQDRDGFRLLRHGRERGLRIINSPTVDATGVAVSTRENGEPAYSFSPPVHRCRIVFTTQARDALCEAPVAAVNSFPFGDRAPTAALAEALSRVPGVRMVDLNPRPRLICDIDAYREGFERILAVVSFVKMSDEDSVLVYGETGDAVAERLFGLGAETLLFSHGAKGATVLMKSGLALHVPATPLDEPVLDTMGAGDATLASIVRTVAVSGMPATTGQWREPLRTAMDIAAATCRRAGADLVLP